MSRLDVHDEPNQKLFRVMNVFRTITDESFLEPLFSAVSSLPTSDPRQGFSEVAAALKGVERGFDAVQQEIEAYLRSGHSGVPDPGALRFLENAKESMSRVCDLLQVCSRELNNGDVPVARIAETASLVAEIVLEEAGQFQ